MIGKPGSVSAQALLDSTTQARTESDVILAGATVEEVMSLTTSRPASGGSQASDDYELVQSAEDQALYYAALGGGGYGMPYGALGAAGAATYGDLTEATPVYEAPPPAPYYEPTYYEPTYYAPAPTYYEPVYYEPEPVYYAPQNYITPPSTGDGGLVDPGYYTPVNDGTFY